MQKKHHYALQLLWTGSDDIGTKNYRSYRRDYAIHIPQKPVLFGSSDPSFRGDASKYNPEEMLLMALSSCHMLWYLHICADAGIIVTHYTDQATAIMEEVENGSGKFSEVVLNPCVTITDIALKSKAFSLHQHAHTMCFIANSVNFEVKHLPTILVLNSE